MPNLEVFTPEEATRIGAEAFARGGSSAPAESEEFMACLSARVNPAFGTALPLLEGYVKGWHTAHAESTKDIMSALSAIPTDHLEDRYKDLDTDYSVEFLVEMAELCLRHTKPGTPEAVAIGAYRDSMLKRLDHRQTVGTIAQRLSDRFDKGGELFSAQHGNLALVADRLAEEVEEDWHFGTTVFRFEDGSALEFCGPMFEVVA